MLKRTAFAALPLILLLVVSGIAQPTPAPGLMRGEYGRFRANNDLLSYALKVRVDPAKKTISGSNTITFKMLSADNRIQIDLYPNLKVDKIEFEKAPLKFTREGSAVYIDFPRMLDSGKTYSIDFFYSGTPMTIGRFGGFTFGKDPMGRPWIFTACEGEGASIWWPNKDQWRDEVEKMDLSVEIPNDLVDASNGKFLGKQDLGDGFTRWNWQIDYPINNYDVALNIGKYEHWSDKYRDLPLDFYALPEDLERAKKQFAQAKGMLEAFEHYFGEYPFKKDGYKLIQVPYAGMEHQSAVAYGNRFANGYFERDWTGVGISLRFDFIIIHESGHEWFGNSITAADPSDMWIHEGWTTYLECLYVEYHYGHEDYLKYTNALKKKVQNREPIIGERGKNADPPQDQYFKGALFIHTLRSIVDDDKKWFSMIREFYQHFKYQTIMTEDVAAFFSKKMGMDLTPIFDQYLRHTAIPVLELRFDKEGSVSYRWKADVKGFAMPVKVGEAAKWQTITPTTSWQSMKTSIPKEKFEAATDLFYIDVTKE